MFTNNPFAALTDVLPANVMQIYVVLMVLAVVAGTLFDIVHKGSAKYFFDNWRRSKSKGAQASRRRRDGVARHQDRPGGRPGVRGILQRAPPGRPSADHVRVRDLRRHHRRHGVRLPDARDSDARHPAAALVDRRLDDLRRRILVLVLHPGRCRRRGQFAAAPHARGSVHPLAAGQRDAGPDLGLPASEGRAPGPTCSSACTSSPRRCCSDRCRGPSSRTCSSSPRRPSRRGFPTRTAPGATCPRPADKPEQFGSAREQPRHY